jgi:hypothetical protein
MAVVLSFSKYAYGAQQGLVSGSADAFLAHHPAHSLLPAAFRPGQLALSLLLLAHVVAFYPQSPDGVAL